MTIHDFRMTAGSDHKNLIFDVAVPHGCPLSDEEVASAIARKAAERWGRGTSPWCRWTGHTPTSRRSDLQKIHPSAWPPDIM